MISFRYLLAIAPLVSGGLSAQSATRWYPADSIRVGPASTIDVDVAAGHRVRIVLATPDHAPMATQELDPAPLSHWAESARVGLALGVRTRVEFQNTVALQPAVREGDSTGFVITIADSLGNDRSVYATASETHSFLHALTHAATRLDAHSDDQLTRSRGLASDPVLERCDLVQDSLLVTTAPGTWPFAKPSHGPPFHYPRPPENAQPGQAISAIVVLLADGTPDSTFFGVTGTRDSQYRARVLDYLMNEKWKPGEVSGCPVISRASLTTMGVGISRPRR